MKKFLKVFSVVALICCCMFSFAGCNIFEDKKEEYANLVAERKIVREVVSNTKVMLKSNIEEETQPAAASSGISARGAEDNDSLIDNYIRITEYYLALADSIINDSEFIPGKLYNAEIEEGVDDDKTKYYLLLNAYCDGTDKVTLNFSFVLNSKDIEEYSRESIIIAYDIYYNNEHKPIKTIEHSCTHSLDPDVADAICKDFDYAEVAFSSTGVPTSWHQSRLSISSIETSKYFAEEEGAAGIIEYYEDDFTQEINQIFDAEIEMVKEKTYLHNFARPLPKEALDKLDDAFNRQ